MRKSAANVDVLSTREAAERLGVALRTVQLWVESGVLPAWKTAGGHRRISRAAVERLIEERRQALVGSPAAVAEGRLKVLVVEDQLEQRKLIEMVIQSWGLPIDLITAVDGYSALIAIGRDCPDVLITDLNMPEMDGFRMVQSVCAQGQDWAEMDVIVVTGLSPQEIERRGGLPQGARVFYKPIAFDDLEDVITSRLARRRPTQDSAA